MNEPAPAEPTPTEGPVPDADAAGRASDDERLADLAEEFSLRHRRGERPSVESYARAHPSLAGPIAELFPGLLALEEADAGSTSDAFSGVEKVGTTVGRYKLLERLGEGGFGVVFMAEQLTPVRRKVALKVIKPGLDTRQVIARFEAERQALALMDHENVARVLDAGATEAGRPYFVMELVRGVPLTDYCETNQVAPRERLRLFARVCRAVQHAHTKGIIHRDLKPTNVLVTLHDGVPVPKVIDFGVAKATGPQSLTDKTLFTQFAQMVGTPLYMSPEQAELSGLDVDTRSDVYSLGVLLYELLTGTTPLDRERLKRAAFDEVRRIIREEEPPPPSTRLSTLGGGLPDGPGRLKGDLKRLGQLVRGELDWIVMKALEKNRALRYETASGLAADVERYLNDEAVHACPPSSTYRLRKLLRRHKKSVIAASLIASALIAGIVGTTWGIARIRVVAAEKEVALIAARSSAREAQDRLYLQLLSQARAQRGSGHAGQRFDTLRAIAKASQIRVTTELRDEAAAALVLPDIELAQEWEDGDPTSEVTFSFEGDTIHYARVSQQGAVTICRVTGGKEEKVTELPTDGGSVIRGPWWSGDRRFLAYGHGGTDADCGATLRIWKLDGPTPRVVLDEPLGVNRWGFAFHSGGRKCAVAHAAGNVTVYDLDTGRRQPLAVGKVMGLAFHPGDDRLAVAGEYLVRIFDSNTGAELKTLPLDQLKGTSGIRCLAWHPDGRRVAVGCYDHKIHVFDADSGSENLPAWEGDDVFETIIFNHAGDQLLGHEWRVGDTRLWDVATGRPLFSTPRELRYDSIFSPDDRFVGCSRSRGTIQVWRLASGRELRVLGPLRPGAGDELDGRVTDGSGRIFMASADNRLCFFDTTNGEELASVPTPHKAAMPFGFDPAGGWLTGGTRGAMLWPLRPDPGRPESLRVGPPQLLASGNLGHVRPDSAAHEPRAIGIDHVTLLPRVPDSERAGRLPAAPPQPLISGVGTHDWRYSGASRDGRVLSINDYASAILVHRDRAGPPVSLGPQPGMGDTKVSPDGNWVATCTLWPDGSSKTVRIWDGRDGRSVADLPLTNRAWCRFSPDGHWLGTAGPGDSQLWKVGTWDKPVRSFLGDFIFSPDGNLMALTDVVGSIRLVKTATGEEVARVTGPERRTYRPLCFTPDGTRLIASLGAFYVWDLRLIREQLRAIGLDWDPKDWPPFPAEPSDTRGRLRLTVDTGAPAPQHSGASSQPFQEPRP